jgi:YggT family protein
MNTLAAIVGIVIMVLQWFIWLLILQAILSWLIAFNVINTYNSFVRGVLRFLTAVTEPLLRPIQRILPDLGGIDLSPMVLILIIILIQRLLPAILLDTGVI